MKDRLEELRTEGLQALGEASSLSMLKAREVELLGRKGALTTLLKGVGALAPEDRVPPRRAPAVVAGICAGRPAHPERRMTPESTREWTLP